MTELRQLAADEIADQPMRWPVIAHRVLGRGAVSEFVADQVRTPDGETMTRQYLLHPGAVGVIAWDEADRIAVVRQYRHPVAFRLTEPPAGLLDHADEDFAIAAARELAEEAGLQATRWQVLVDLFTSPGANQESLRIYLARDLRFAPAPEGYVADHEEADMEACWVPRADLVDALFAGRLQNPTMAAGVLALEAARLSGRLESLRPVDAPWPARDAWREQREALTALGDGDRA
ncbi:MAG: NUDIX hydrolase [Propionicimonas sp.]